MTKIKIKVHVEYSNHQSATGLQVAVHEVFTTNESVVIGRTNEFGEVEGDLRERRQVRVYDEPFCVWPGCKTHDEDDVFDRPGVTLTITDVAGNEFTTPGFTSHMFEHVHVILPPWFASSFTNPKSVGQLLRRKNLVRDFSPAEQRELADLVLGHLDDTIIDAHMDQVDHIDNLFTDHRSYLYEIEKKLLRDGHVKYVPLPIWDAIDNIPMGWERVQRHHDHTLLPLLPYNLSPLGLRPQLPEKLRSDRLCVEGIATADTLAWTIGKSAMSSPGSYHFNAHAVLGGPFLSMSTAGAALMFWAFHPLLVEVYDKWLTCKFGTGNQISVGVYRDDDSMSRMGLFRVGVDGKLWHSFQRRTCVMRNDLDHPMPSHPVTFDHWSHWQRIGEDRDISRFKVVTDSEGRLVVIAKGKDNLLFLMRGTDEIWSPWTDLGIEAGDFHAAQNANGSLELVAFRRVGTAWTLASATEQPVITGTFGRWTDRTRPLQPGNVDAKRDKNGHVHVFFRTSDGKLHHIWKTDQWSGPRTVSDKPVRTFEVHANEDGRLELFVLRPSDDGIYHSWVTSSQVNGTWGAPGTWSGWARFGTVQFNSMTVARNGDGRLEVFGVDVAGRVRNTWQMNVNSGWSQCRAGAPSDR
jgi:hypothetical protein